ncbi:MAG: cupin domain-containing protein [Myxococcota bacterium]|nr:cupin domain-containing protein [Myxococcota bacterium]
MMRNPIENLFRFVRRAVSARAASAASAIDHQSGTAPYQAISAVAIPIEEASKTVLGQTYAFPAGTPLIKIFKITIEPGMKTGPHKHEIPLLAYVLSGELGVDYGSRGKRSFAAGQSYIEAIDWCHVGYAAGDEAVEILGVYLGQQEPDQIKPERCDTTD